LVKSLLHKLSLTEKREREREIEREKERERERKKAERERAYNKIPGNIGLSN
jgi:hypothetical protein